MKLYYLLLLVAANGFGQTPHSIPGLRYTQFDIPFSVGDTAQVVVSADASDLKKKKGLFVFVQGSLPNPLAIFQDTIAYGVFPFQCREFHEQYHFIAVSKPGIPVMAQVRELNQNMCYHDPATGLPPDRFRQNNHLDYYVAQHQAALNWILQQPWADTSRVIVCGGSQGATVASKLASVYPAITHLIYYSGNPNGRLDEEVRRIQQDVATGKTAAVDATRKLQELQLYWEWLYAHADTMASENGGDAPKTTVSFSSPARAWLTQLNIPVLVAFGTADLTAAPCATLPLDFLRAGKKNLTLKIYPNYDHHFFEIQPNGMEPQYRMNDAFREWMAWVR